MTAEDEDASPKELDLGTGDGRIESAPEASFAARHLVRLLLVVVGFGVVVIAHGFLRCN